MTGYLLAIAGFASPLLWTMAARAVTGQRGGGPRFYLTWWCSGIGWALIAAGLSWQFAQGSWASGVLAAILWWVSRWRRKRKRSPRTAGGRALARIKEMVRNMPKPGPVLRPVPQGAGT